MPEFLIIRHGQSQADLWLGTGDTGIHLWRVRGNTRWVLLGNSLVHLLEAPC